MGAEIVRPSSSSTVRLSSVTSTWRAVADRISIAKVVIPLSQQVLQVFLYEFVQPSDLSSAKPATAAKSDRIKPEFRDLVMAFNVNVWRFISITRVEEESVRFNPQYGRPDFLYHSTHLLKGYHR